MPNSQANSNNRSRRRVEPDTEPDTDSFQAQAEQWSRRLGESAQHVWWAGLGALQRAQAEGSRLFDTLVQEGAEAERDGRQRAESVRDEVESRFDQVRETANSGWSRLERAFDDRLRSALRRLETPEREELETLRRQVQSLRSQVTKLSAEVRAARPAGGTGEALDEAQEPGS